MGPDSIDAATPPKAATKASAPALGFCPAPPDNSRPWRWAIAAATMVVSLAAAGCQNMVAESGIYYNAGLANSYNRLLLANIVRAAKGEPTYFSAIGDYSASTSAQSSTSIDADLPFEPISEGSLSVSLGPSKSRDRNANVSSLESKDFAQAMHTPISPNLLVFLVEGRDGNQLNLVFALAVKRVTLLASDYRQLVGDAIETCNTSLASLPSTQRGICRSFSTVLADAACAGQVRGADDTLVGLYNDPTNACEYARFRLFAETMAVIQPRVTVGDDGAAVFSIGSGTSTSRLFGAPGTGFALRSPNEVIQYLGEIVRVRYERGTSAIPRLSARTGVSVPIFVIETGSAARNSPDSVQIDGTIYALPRQRLGAGDNDFSYRSLVIVKDLLSLNTLQGQLPKSPTIVVGGSNT